MSQEIYEIKITILDVQKPIWRKLLIPSGITFYRLHKIIQGAFGWFDYHLFEFEFPDMLIKIPEPESPSNKPELNAKKVYIDPFLEKYNSFIYVYDFGDYWQHKIELEQFHNIYDLGEYPKCIAGEGHRPPEDVGGTMGYREFLNIIQDPNHPEYDEMLQWAEKDTNGRKFDPDYFYVHEVNRRLAKYRAK